MKRLLIFLALVFSTGCSIPYWIEYSFEYTSDKERLCVVSFLKGLGYKGVYENEGKGKRLFLNFLEVFSMNEGGLATKEAKQWKSKANHTATQVI